MLKASASRFDGDPDFNFDYWSDNATTSVEQDQVPFIASAVDLDSRVSGSQAPSGRGQCVLPAS